MDISNFVPQIAALLGLQPSTFLLFLGLITCAANVGARLIPNDATGALGVLRQLCAIIGVYVSSRVSSGVTVNDVTSAALKTAPIANKVAADTGPKQGEGILQSHWIAAAGAAVVALLLCSCATVGSPQTPAQQLYAAIGAYDAALHGATTYAAEPGAKPEIKHALNVAATKAMPAVAFARAYPLCHAGVVQIAQNGRPCASFDFSPQGILADVALLQSAIIALQQRN